MTSNLSHEGLSKGFKPQPERSTIAEHFCLSKTLSLLMKQEKSELVFLVL